MTRQGNLKDHQGNKLAPNTLAAAVYDAARQQALSASLLNLIEKEVLGIPTFSTAAQYAVGDIVFYDRRIYRFTAEHSGAWDASDVEAVSLGDIFASIKSLEDGDVVPAIAENLRAWAEQSDLSVDDTWTDTVRTTGGNNPIVTDEGGKIVRITPKSDFTAKAFVATGYNQLKSTLLGALFSQPFLGGIVSGGWYFLVSELTYGSFGNAEENNGLLFTNADGENMRPTVRFQPLASGYPTSANDGTVVTPTEVIFGGKTYYTYTTSGPGWLIVTGIDRDTTCAHVAWEDWYDRYIPMSDTEDTCGVIVLDKLFEVVHSDKILRTIAVGGNVVADSVEFGETAATWARRVNVESVGAYDAASGTKWTDTPNESEGEIVSYTHSVVISAMKSGGLAQILGGIALEVDGTTVSYTDANEHAAACSIKYELATVATGTKAYTDAVFAGSNFDLTNGKYPLNDCGFEALAEASGEAYVTSLYAQNYPDAVAELVRMKLSNMTRVVAEAIAALRRDLSGIQFDLAEGTLDIKARNLESEEVPRRLGQPIFALVDAAPTELPHSLGLLRFNPSNGALYVSKAVTGATSDWKQVL